MNIGIVGSGNIGGTAARLFAGAGHDVAISNSRGPGAVQPLVEQIGAHARAATVEEAAAFGEVVLVAIPFAAYPELPAPAFAGKIVIDATNYYPQRDGEIDLGALTSSELAASFLPGTRLVKAFNTLWSETLAKGGKPGAPRDERLALLVAGDDASAKAVVSKLIDDIGWGAIDTGTLHDGDRWQGPSSPLYNVPVTVPQAEQRIS